MGPTTQRIRYCPHKQRTANTACNLCNKIAHAGCSSPQLGRHNISLDCEKDRKNHSKAERREDDACYEPCNWQLYDKHFVQCKYEGHEASQRYEIWPAIFTALLPFIRQEPSQGRRQYHNQKAQPKNHARRTGIQFIGPLHYSRHPHRQRGCCENKKALSDSIEPPGFYFEECSPFPEKCSAQGRFTIRLD